MLYKSIDFKNIFAFILYKYSLFVYYALCVGKIVKQYFGPMAEHWTQTWCISWQRQQEAVQRVLLSLRTWGASQGGFSTRARARPALTSAGCVKRATWRRSEGERSAHSSSTEVLRGRTGTEVSLNFLSCFEWTFFCNISNSVFKFRCICDFDT